VREFEEDGPCLPDSNSGTVVRIQGFFATISRTAQQRWQETQMPVGASVCSFRKAALKTRGVTNRDLTSGGEPTIPLS
jgi:hypothetical protein